MESQHCERRKAAIVCSDDFVLFGWCLSVCVCVCVYSSRYIAKQTASRITIEKTEKIFPFLPPFYIPMILNTHKQSEKKEKK